MKWSKLVLCFSLLVLNSCSKLKKVVTIGIAPWSDSPEYKENISGFKDTLSQYYKEGENLKYIELNANADIKKQKEIIQLFINKKVDLIYTLTTPGTLIAKSYTKTIPIVFSIVTFPVQARIINSLQNSGNNLVGTSNYMDPARQYYAFESIYPNSKAIGFVHRHGEVNSEIQYQEFKDLLSKRGIKVLDLAVTDAKQLVSVLEKENSHYDSLYAACDTLVQTEGEDLIIKHALKYHKPSFGCIASGIEKGTLVGNVADYYEIGVKSGELAKEILRGAEPSWLLTEHPNKDRILVNLKTAKTLGIKIPDTFMSEVAKAYN